MAEYIEREAAIAYLEKLKRIAIENNFVLSADEDAIIKFLKEKCPTADVVEVVRCKDCRHAFFRYNNDRYPFGVYACRKQPSGRAYKKVRGDFWCAYGEKMDGKGDE